MTLDQLINKLQKFKEENPDKSGDKIEIGIGVIGQETTIVEINQVSWPNYTSYKTEEYTVIRFKNDPK